MDNILNLEIFRKLRESGNFEEAAVKVILQLQSQNKELEEKVTHLEDLLKNSNVPQIGYKIEDGPLARKSHQEEIIEVEFKRLHDLAVMQNSPLRGDDLKKFEILIKCYVGLKNGAKLKKPTEKETQETEEDLISLVKGNSDGSQN